MDSVRSLLWKMNPNTLGWGTAQCDLQPYLEMEQSHRSENNFMLRCHRSEYEPKAMKERRSHHGMWSEGRKSIPDRKIVREYRFPVLGSPLPLVRRVTLKAYSAIANRRRTTITYLLRPLKVSTISISDLWQLILKLDAELYNSFIEDDRLWIWQLEAEGWMRTAGLGAMLGSVLSSHRPYRREGLIQNFQVSPTYIRLD